MPEVLVGEGFGEVAQADEFGIGDEVPVLEGEPDAGAEGDDEDDGIEDEDGGGVDECEGAGAAEAAPDAVTA